MKVQQSFVVEGRPEALFELLEQVDRVARCLPGVEEVELLDRDNSRLRLTQSLGPLSTTFDVKLQVTEREPPSKLAFTAVGRSVGGASGSLRSANAVRLEPVNGGSTRVLLEADVALGGMIGSVGQKVVAKQAARLTRAFAEALERELRGEAPPVTEAAGRKPPVRPSAAPERAPDPTAIAEWLALARHSPLAAAAVVGAVAGYFAGWLATRRSHHTTRGGNRS